jgi:threonine 3-dehydrogenase
MLSAPSDVDPAAAMRSNALGTFHVLEAARLFDVKQVLFSSTIGTYGYDIREAVISDYTLQRPMVFYGATKVFAEHMGLFYRRKYGIDFRGVRYPSIVGPGVRTPGMANYTSWVIEECAKGKPFTIWVNPETTVPILYFKDAARALVQLSEAPRSSIQMVNYILAGITPMPSASDLADLVRCNIPGAQIDFQTDPEIQRIMDAAVKPIDDTRAQQEWNWKYLYDQEALVKDFLHELAIHPDRYQ